MTRFWQIATAVLVCIEDVLQLAASAYLLLSPTLNFGLLMHLATLHGAVGWDLDRLNKFLD